MFVFAGCIATTYAYDAALADTATGMYGIGADNLRVREGSLRYSLEGAVTQVTLRTLRFCQTIQTMSAVHRLLRYAGKGSSFRFSARDAIPFSVPRPEDQTAIDLYDSHVADSQSAFIRGGTQLVDENQGAGDKALTVQRMVPKLLPAAIGRHPNHQEVDVL
jgi:hypothetical protein